MAILLLLATALPLAAQSSDAPTVSFRPFFLVSAERAAAKQTFEAVFGQSLQTFWGGGVQVALRSGIYVEVSASRFEKTGQRAFVFNGQAFPLGIPLTAKITPLEVSAGYRFTVSPRIIPYAGAGIARYAYVETSDFSDSGENVDTTHTGYLVLGGVEYRAHRWVGVSVDVATHVTGPSSAVRASPRTLAKTMGGTAVRVKVLVGR